MKTYAVALCTILFCSFMETKPSAPLKYIALGDSYTICTGTQSPAERWPNLLANDLSKAGIKTQLIANPSQNGLSTQNLIDLELPIVAKEKPDFVTLLIGVNDWVREVDATTYQKNLIYILDQLQQQLPHKNNILLITIPDFGVTPQGAVYSKGRNISDGIASFNDIIKAEAKKRNLRCIDIYPHTQLMQHDKTLIAPDGLHPSAKEYGLWEKLILPEAIQLLKQEK